MNSGDFYYPLISFFIFIIVLLIVLLCFRITDNMVIQYCIDNNNTYINFDYQGMKLDYCGDSIDKIITELNKLRGEI